MRSKRQETDSEEHLPSPGSATSLAHTEGPRAWLLRILLADKESARQALEQVSRANAWETVFRLSEVWSVVPQVAQRLRDLGVESQPTCYPSFRRVLIETYARSASRASRGAAALGHLQKRGVPALAFKGLASMARLYHPQPNRTIKDADLLVEEVHIAHAIEYLAEIGFTAVDGHELIRLQAYLENSPGFSGNLAIVLRDTTGFEIDLHWSVGIPSLTPSALLERSEVVPLLGASVQAVSVADGLVLTARHSIRENLSIDMICRDLFDVCFSCAYLDREHTLDVAVDHATHVGSPIPLLALTGILCALDPINQSAASALRAFTRHATSAEVRSGRQLQHLFFQQVDGCLIDKDLLYLFHTRPLRQILSGALTNWTEYRGFMRAMEEKLDGKEVPMHQRLRKLAGAARGFGPGSLRSLRTLARLKHDA